MPDASVPSAVTTGGILTRRRGAFVLLDAIDPTAGDISVPGQLVQEHGLVEGATVTGPLGEAGHRPALRSVDTVCGLSPAAYRQRTPFARLVAVHPNQRFDMSNGGLAMRAVDLLAPIGMGTRGLIVAPPQAGKTTLLEQLAHGIRAAEPTVRIVVLLIDERPEEVTYFRRNVAAEVFASSSDQPVAEHTRLAELMLAHVRVELECGNHVVVLLDSLTRLVRAFNRGGRGGSRTLSGGIDASALEIPRRFFGLARNVEGGGSATVIGTVLIDTGSRLDQVVYEEFKSTGNSEIVLDRALAQERIFPAIDVHRTSTRREEELYPPDLASRLAILRRALTPYPTAEAMRQLLQVLGQFPNNDELLRRISRLSP